MVSANLILSSNITELLAVFTAGLVFTSGESSEDKEQDEHFMESFDTIIVLIAFVLIATIFPWHEWRQIGYGPLFWWTVGIVFARRLPWVLLLPWLPMHISPWPPSRDFLLGASTSMALPHKSSWFPSDWWGTSSK